MVRLTALRITLITRMRLLFISTNAKSISRAAWPVHYHHRCVIEHLSFLYTYGILHSRKRALAAFHHEITGYKVVGACPVSSAKWLRLLQIRSGNELALNVCITLSLNHKSSGMFVSS